MLKHLHIRNLAIIEEMDLEFDPGMTVFTGETGAGKSILIDAIGLILGDRADSSIIRDTLDQAEILASFDTREITGIRDILEEQALEAGGDELTIRRVVNRDGRSRAYINGSQVPAQALKTLGECLIDIHGQHAHQSLMRRTVQRNLLDCYARHFPLLEEVGKAFSQWHAATRTLEDLNTGAKGHEATIALLRYQVQELTDLGLDDEEFSQLEEEHRRLSNAALLMETSHALLAALKDSDDSVDARIHRAHRDLKDLLKLDSSAGRIVSLLENASIQFIEAVDELRQYADRLESDPERLDGIEGRLNALHDMARKHHVHPRELTGHLRSLEDRLNELDSNRETIDKLVKEQAASLHRYLQAAGKLHASRLKASTAMAREISARLTQLGMPEGEFIVEVVQSESDRPQAEGLDQVEYLVSLNPGLPPQPLRKVASGGELSRISLAVQIVCRDEKGAPTLIFDEVDAGIGGRIAEIVGNLLKDLAMRHQVFCVTHLPQVASQGDHHVQVSKFTEKSSTYTNVTPLKDEARIEEIARMLGGIRISEKTRAHAREMLTRKSPAA